MKILEAIDRLLREAVLTSELTVGFELEGYIANEKFDDVKQKMEREWGMSVYQDGSVKPPARNTSSKSASGGSPLARGRQKAVSNYVGFEADMGYGPVSPRWLKTVVARLEEAFAMGVRTNESCGFHAHFGFGNLEKKSDKVAMVENALLVWHLVENGIVDDYMSFRGIDQFSDAYASLETSKAFVSSVNKLILSYNGGKLNRSQFLRKTLQVIELHTVKKHTLLHIHSSGTLEWRGLRGVLREDMDWTSKLIKQYIYKFVYGFGKEIADVLTEISKGPVFPAIDVTKQDLLDFGDADLVNKRIGKIGLRALNKGYPEIAHILQQAETTEEKELASEIVENYGRFQDYLLELRNPREVAIRPHPKKSSSIVIEGAKYQRFSRHMKYMRGWSIVLENAHWIGGYMYDVRRGRRAPTMRFRESVIEQCEVHVMFQSTFFRQDFSGMSNEEQKSLVLDVMSENFSGGNTLKDVTVWVGDGSRSPIRVDIDNETFQ